MTDSPDKPLMRSLGEFFGHIAKGIRTKPVDSNRRETRRTVEEERRDNVVLRRTTIEEIEIQPNSEETPPNDA